MGQEIESSSFSQRDFDEFTVRLKTETELLGQWFAQRRFSSESRIAGFELEAWLVDGAGRPAPVNEQYLERLHSKKLVPELSRFNVELNTDPLALSGDVLARMQRSLETAWKRRNAVAADLGVQLVMVGILPSVREDDLTLKNMSDMARYRALNDQVLRMRHGKPIQLDIHGHERLQTSHTDVMLEAATTSFQVHLQVNIDNATRYYNAALIASAPMVAITANSPFLFGRDLWAETRIPLFEQSVNTGEQPRPAGCPQGRVTFGTDYPSQSVFEIFLRNLECYPVLLPAYADEPAEKMSHLRLHNGTIWRWNRALIGFAADGVPHLRIEHRVMPAGPSVVDTIANAALFYGLAHALASADTAPESRLVFDSAKDNFYAAARHGLEAELRWLDGQPYLARELLLETIIPMAEEGLSALGLDAGDICYYLDIIRQRALTEQHGSAWLRRYRARHDCDMETLTKVYLRHQAEGKPVHEWPV
jgi:gamma-glutamyl:cysteine ligase YbdK (ATP-grasp superfamily)